MQYTHMAGVMFGMFGIITFGRRSLESKKHNIVIKKQVLHLLSILTELQDLIGKFYKKYKMW